MYANIKRLAKEQRKTIMQMEKDLGFGSGSICRWDTIKPSYDKVVKVANYLNVPLEELLEL